MLICRRGEWRVESDGHLSSSELEGLDGLRAIEAWRAREAERAAQRAAERVRALKRRAWRRGYEAGRRAALQQFVAAPAATAFASRRLDARLADLVLDTVAAILGELPADAALPARLRRCLDASCAQQVLSVRVSTDAYEEARRCLRALADELNAPAFTVLADAGLPAHALVVETEGGVIDGSLAPQLRALEQGTRAAIETLLDEYRYLDGAAAKAFDTLARALGELRASLAAPAGQREEREPREPRRDHA